MAFKDTVYGQIGSLDTAKQWNSWTGTTRGVDWFGYSFPKRFLLTGITYQEGVHFTNGGWWNNAPNVEVWDFGVPVVVQAQWTPSYSSVNPSFQIYGISIQPTIGSEIRLTGSPGGSSTFVSVGEMRVYADTTDVPLPIQFGSFGIMNLFDGTIQLNWTTISETNNYGFNVERGYDGATFSVVAFIPGHGTTNIPQEYVWPDSIHSRPHLWYRLKQIDFSGASHTIGPWYYRQPVRKVEYAE